VSYEYDKNGNKILETTTTNFSPETTVIKKTVLVYDAINRVVKVIAPGMASDGSEALETKGYNADNAEVKNIDAKGNEIEFLYDRNGRLVTTVDQMGNRMTKVYDDNGKVIAETDQNGNTTRFEYDFLGNLKVVTNALGEKTHYIYDLNGNMISQTDGNGHTITMEYNARNQVVRRIDHGGRTGIDGKYVYDQKKTVEYKYNPNGSVKEMLDRNGVTKKRIQLRVVGKMSLKIQMLCSRKYLKRLEYSMSIIV